MEGDPKWQTNITNTDANDDECLTIDDHPSMETQNSSNEDIPSAVSNMESCGEESELKNNTGIPTSDETSEKSKGATSEATGVGNRTDAPKNSERQSHQNTMEDPEMGQYKYAIDDDPDVTTNKREKMEGLRMSLREPTPETELQRAAASEKSLQEGEQSPDPRGAGTSKTSVHKGEQSSVDEPQEAGRSKKSLLEQRPSDSKAQKPASEKSLRDKGRAPDEDISECPDTVQPKPKPKPKPFAPDEQRMERGIKPSTPDHSNLPYIPGTNIGVAVLVTLCFNLPFGILAIYFSLMATKAYRDGHPKKGEKKARISVYISLFSIVVTVLVVTVIVLMKAMDGQPDRMRYATKTSISL